VRYGGGAGARPGGNSGGDAKPEVVLAAWYMLCTDADDVNGTDSPTAPPLVVEGRVPDAMYGDESGSMYGY
jgi:hypothetical protein